MTPQTSSSLSAIKLPKRFSPVEHLGTGGQGNVYRVYDQKFRDFIALKLLNVVTVENKESLKAEFRALSGLSDYGFVEVYELFLNEDIPFFTMEFVVGKPLFTVSQPAPDIPILLNRFAQLATALHALHRSGKIHRDIKPSNILVTLDGQVRVLDLGLVRSHGIGKPTGPTIGTFEYMAPEQLSSEAQPSADWYGYGVLLFQALSGQLPFPELDALRKKLDSPAPRLSSLVQVPPDLDGLVSELLDLRQEKRPDFERIMATFRSLGVELPALPTPPGPSFSPFQEQELSHLLKIEQQSGFRLVQITGSAGSGKNRLIERFRKKSSSKVLSSQGWCCEFESSQLLPELVDQLSLLLLGTPDYPLLLPSNARAITSLSSQAKRVFENIPKTPLPPGINARRRMGTTVLLKLIAVMSQRYPLTIALDNLHDTDHESIQFIYALIEEKPDIFLILASKHPILPAVTVLELPESQVWNNPHHVQTVSSQLPLPAVQLLRLCAVASRPVQLELLVERYSSGLRGVIGLLISKNLLSLDNRGQDVVLSTTCLRQHIVAGLSEAEKESLNWELFVLFLSQKELDLETLLSFGKGIEQKEAGRFVAMMADQAREEQQFALAARRYEVAISLEHNDNQIYFNMAKCLARIGQFLLAAQALETYLARERPASPAQIRFQIAEQYLAIGKIQAGLDALRQSLKEQNIQYPEKIRFTLVRNLLYRLWFRVRGYRRERPAASVSAQQQHHADTMLATANVLTLITPLYADYFGLRHLFFAIRYGDASRMCRALGMEALFESALGGWWENSGRKIAQDVLWLADRTGKSTDVAWAHLIACAVHTVRGEFRQAVEFGARAQRIYFQECPESWYELGLLTLYQTASLAYLGDLVGIQAWNESIGWFAESKKITLNFNVWRLGLPMLPIMAQDKPHEAVAIVEQIMNTWEMTGEFSFHRLRVAHTLTTAALYQGDALGAWQLLERQWSQISTTRLFSFPFISTESWFLRGRVLLALLHQSPQPFAHQDALLETITALESIPKSYANAFACMLKAGTKAKDDPRAASTFLSEADILLGRDGLMMHRDVCRERQVSLEKNVNLARIRIHKDLSDRGIINIKRFLNILLPWPTAESTTAT